MPKNQVFGQPAGGYWKERDFGSYDAVYHVAGIAHSDAVRMAGEEKALYYAVNTDLTLDVAKKAKEDGVRQFIFMSSIIVYGDMANPVGTPKERLRVIKADTPVVPAKLSEAEPSGAENICISKGHELSFHVIYYQSL